MILPDLVRASIVAAEPLLGYYLARSDVVEDNSLPGEAAIDVVNGKLTLYLNGKLFGACSTKMQIGIILHEYLHVLLLHCDKRALGAKEDAWIANVAQDMAINPAILVHYELPIDSVFPDRLPYNFPPHRASEFYFEQLTQDREKFQAVFGAAPDQQVSPQIFDCLTEMAADFQTIGGSSCSGGLLGPNQNLLMQLNQAVGRLHWQGVLKRFQRAVVGGKRVPGGRRFSRRLGSPFPGQASRGHPYLPVILDTSASTKPKLQEALDEIFSLLGRTKIRLYQCDDQLRSVDFLKKNEKIEIRGFGGTDLQPAVDRCKFDRCKRILIASDRQFERQLNLHRMQVVWLDISGETKLVEGPQ